MKDQTMGDQDTDPCYQDRSLCATRMGEMAESWALLSTCLGSENRQTVVQYRDIKLFSFISGVE